MPAATKTATRPPTTGKCARCKRPFSDDYCKSCNRPLDPPDPEKERDLRAKILALETENRQLRALDPVRGLDKANRELVHRLIGVLTELEEAGDPMPGGNPTAQIRVKHANSTVDPGAHTRWARDMTRWIHSQISGLCATYESRKNGMRKPPKKEKVRCVNKRCPNYGRRIDRFVGPEGPSRIEMLNCTNCGNRLTGA